MNGRLQAAPVCLPTCQVPRDEGKKQEHPLVMPPAVHRFL
jgi:hypothetical protein